MVQKVEWVKGQTLRQPSAASVVRCNPTTPSGLTIRAGSYADELVKTAEQLRAKGIQVLGVVCHVSSAQQRKNLIDKTVQVTFTLKLIIIINTNLFNFDI